MKKKILSIILAISMIMSLVPVISASAEGEAPYQLVYDFKNIDGYEKDQKLTEDIGFTQTDGTWAFHSWNGLDGDTVTYKPNYGIEIKSDSVGDYFAVKINVPYGGDYIPSLTYYELDTKDDAKYVAADVYVLPKDSDVSTASESDKTVIAKNLYFCKNGGKNTDKDLGEYVSETPVTLSAGEHILVFYVTRCNGTLSAGNTRLRPGVLTLTSGTLAEGASYATVPMYMEASVEEAELKVGESAALTVSGWMNDGTEFDEASDTVSFVSKNGKLSITDNTATAIGEGADIITATVTSSGKSISKDIPVTVLPASPAYQLVYDFIEIEGYEHNDLFQQDVGFAETDGRWAFHSWNGIETDSTTGKEKVTYKSNYGLEINTNSVGDYFAVKINVPYGGTYVPTLKYMELNSNSDSNYSKADVYILPEGSDISTAADSDKKIIAEDLYFNKNGGVNTGSSRYNELAEYTPGDSIRLSAGENILVFKVTDCGGSSSYTRVRPSKLTLTSGTPAEDDSYVTVPMYISEAKANDAELEIGDTTTLEVSGWMNDGTAFDENSADVSFNTESENISIVGNTVTASAAGTATVTATVTSGEKLLSEDIAITVTSADIKQITDAFTVTSNETGYNVTASAVVYVEDEDNHGIVASATKNGDIYEMKAPTKDGYTFLYWAKALEANKKIVSLAAEFNYKPAANESNILIAVYKKTSASETSDTAEFYNANGQLLYTTAEDSIDENNVTVEDGILTIPALPTMAGYSTATHWQLYGDEEAVQYGADVDTVELSGTMIFVASYPEAPTKTVEVNGKSVAYGTPVTFTADPSKGALKWWIKEVNGVDEIVSIEDTYSFLAWENCTVTGVYGEAKPVYTGQKMKIIIDTFDIDGIMAEFIGFENASVVEKGIMYNNKKISMTTDKPQFTVSGDTGTFKGYAIIKVAENQFKEIIDGEVTK
ncbi:MAG: hypothetical protein IJE70_00680 [Oscillospiraceae bacterium]|nr:hypothetical protein [Oscillospiraceae bacterium]